MKNEKKEFGKPRSAGFSKSKTNGEFGDGDRSFKKRSDNFKSDGPKSDRPFNKRSEGNSGKFSDRKEGGFKRSFDGDKPSFKRKSEGDFGDKRERKSFGDGDKPSFKRKSDGDFGDKRERKSFGDGDRPAFKRKSEGDFGDKRERKSFGDGDRPAFKRKSEGDFGDKRERKSFGDGDRPAFKRKSEGDFGDKRERKSFGDGDRPAFKRKSEGDFGDKRERKSFGDGDRPAFKRKSEGDFGDKRERKSFGDGDFKPRRKFDNNESTDGEGGLKKRRSFDGNDSRKDRERKFDAKPKRQPKPEVEEETEKEPELTKNGKVKIAVHRSFRDEKTGRPNKKAKPAEPEAESDKEEIELDIDFTDVTPKKSGKKAQEFDVFDDDDDEVNEKNFMAGVHKKRAKKPLVNPEERMPLNKFVAHCGVCSRRDAADLVRTGQIKVNGAVIDEPGFKVDTEDVITYNDLVLKIKKGLVYVLLNKPKDYITTTDDPQGRRTVLNLLDGVEADRIYPVGRLDRNTTGLLLLTNDGDLAQKLAHPSNNIKKVYKATLDQPLTKADFDKIAEGVELEDGKAIVDEIAYLEKKNEIGLEIHTGRNRIVRRIFESLGYEVEKLDRVLYAGLTKKLLPRGKWRYLNEKEIVILKNFKLGK